MTLFIQDPADPEAPYLLERILDACNSASTGVGAFAWATAMGLKLLLEDKTFASFMSRGAFELVVGLDAITNVHALNTLDAIGQRTPKLRTRVFLHQRTNTLFHPKMCWFGSAKGGTLIAGSGNLTVGGLRGNWEAFTLTRLSASDVNALDKQWREWMARHAGALKAPSDAEALAEAAKNTGWESRQRPKGGKTPEEASLDQTSTAELTFDAPVLIAEIPRAGDRWNQANFDIGTYEGYFGAKVGTQRRVLLQHVNDNGALGELESRPSVEVRSHNYRFELAAAVGIPYPASDRPIAVFVRQPTGIILYRLLLPTDPHYLKVQSLLASRWKGRADRMRRITTTASELQASWPEAPFWLTDRPNE